MARKCIECGGEGRWYGVVDVDVQGEGNGEVLYSPILGDIVCQRCDGTGIDPLSDIVEALVETANYRSNVNDPMAALGRLYELVARLDGEMEEVKP